MIHDNNSTNNTNNHNQIMLTYELLYLLQWLMDHESEALKKIIVRSIKKGFNKSRYTSDDLMEMHSSEASMHQSVIEFLGLLDALLIESIHELSDEKRLERSLIPALNHIDTTICDDEIVNGSLKKASAQLNSHPEESPQDLLLKELLKRWKPDKKHIIN